MGRFFLIFSVLRKGKKLAHVEVWKTASALTAALAIVLPDALKLACGFGVCLDLTPSQISDTATALGQLGAGVFLLYTIVATTDRIGL